MSDLDSFLQEIDQIEVAIASNPDLVEDDAPLSLDQDPLKKKEGSKSSGGDVAQPVKDQDSTEPRKENDVPTTSATSDMSLTKDTLATHTRDAKSSDTKAPSSRKQDNGKSTTTSSATITSSFKPSVVRKRPLIAAPPVIRPVSEISSPAVPKYSISRPAAPKPPAQMFGSDILFNAVTEALMTSDPSLASTSTSKSAPLLPNPVSTQSPVGYPPAHNVHAYAAAGIPVPSPTDSVSSSTTIGHDGAAFSAGVKRSSRTVRRCAGDVWEDKTLADWPEDDYRLFVGDIGGDVNDAMLANAFSKYPSFAKARMVVDRNKSGGKARGYGFVSFLDPWDCLAALKNEQGKYLGARPMKLRKSNWKNKDIKESKRREKEHEKRLAQGF